jgi:hypothetical protein
VFYRGSLVSCRVVGWRLTRKGGKGGKGYPAECYPEPVVVSEKVVEDVGAVDAEAVCAEVVSGIGFSA